MIVAIAPVVRLDRRGDILVAIEIIRFGEFRQRIERGRRVVGQIVMQGAQPRAGGDRLGHRGIVAQIPDRIEMMRCRGLGPAFPRCAGDSAGSRRPHRPPRARPHQGMHDTLPDRTECGRCGLRGCHASGNDRSRWHCRRPPAPRRAGPDSAGDTASPGTASAARGSGTRRGNRRRTPTPHGHRAPPRQRPDAPSGARLRRTRCSANDHAPDRVQDRTAIPPHRRCRRVRRAHRDRWRDTTSHRTPPRIRSSAQAASASARAGSAVSGMLPLLGFAGSAATCGVRSAARRRVAAPRSRPPYSRAAPAPRRHPVRISAAAAACRPACGVA